MGDWSVMSCSRMCDMQYHVALPDEGEKNFPFFGAHPRALFEIMKEAFCGNCYVLKIGPRTFLHG